MIKPTLRAVFLFALSAPLALFLAMARPDLWSWSFAYGLMILAAIGFDMLLTPRLKRVVVDVTPTERLFIGETGHCRIRIRARAACHLDLLLEQRGPLDQPRVEHVYARAAASTDHVIALTPRQRGRVFLDALWLRMRGPTGLIEISERRPLGQMIDIVPNVRGVQNAALQFFSSEAIHGVKVQRQKGEGAEFEALRDYVPGLDPRHLDWKHSARHGKLLCKEFQTERNHQIILAFDTGYLMREPIAGLARLDHAINAALVLSWISLRSGDLVGLYGFDAVVRSFHVPMRGLARFSSLQRATAELDYHTEETNFTLGLTELNIRLKRRALIILFTDFVDTVTAELLIENLQRVANRHVVVLVTLRDNLLQNTVDQDPQSFEHVAESVIAQDFIRERSIVFERLQRMGLHCLDVPSTSLSIALINRYLLIKERGLI